VPIGLEQFHDLLSSPVLVAPEVADAVDGALQQARVFPGAIRLQRGDLRCGEGPQFDVGDVGLLPERAMHLPELQRASRKIRGSPQDFADTGGVVVGEAGLGLMEPREARFIAQLDLDRGSAVIGVVGVPEADIDGMPARPVQG
jgi:hypothetical protein